MVLFLITLIVIVIIIERWSRKNALKGVKYSSEPSLLLAAPNEEFNLISKLTNHSRRFISYIRVETILPARTLVHEAPETTRDNEAPRANETKRTNKLTEAITSNIKSRHISSEYLKPRSTLIRNIKVSMPARGRYIFTGARLSGGDFLGLSETHERAEVHNEIVVYPPEITDASMETLMGGFIGDVSVRRFLIEDPIMISGFREYTGREPMKSISWLKSAQASEIMVKTFDYTTDPSVSIILNIELSGEHTSQEHETLVESCYSITHTACRMLEEAGVKYDFYTNAVIYGPIDMWRYVGEGLGQRHFRMILEGLGRGSYVYNESFAALMARAKDSQIGIRSAIIITPGSKMEAAALAGGQREGQMITLSAQSLLEKWV